MIRDDYSNGFHQFASLNSQLRLPSQGSQIQELTPSATDVICGRGKKVFEHEGNRNFRSIVMGKLPQYKAAVSKAQKSAVVSSVFDEVTMEGNFVKQNPQTERWYVVSEAAAREKISQCFRDCLNDKYESTKSTKTTKKRKQTREEAKPKTSNEVKAPECDSLPPPPPKKLCRANTAPASIAYSSKEAFQQLVNFSRSVMPPARRSNSLQTGSSNASNWFEDMEPLNYSAEPIAFPSIAFPSIAVDWHAELEPTPLPFQCGYHMD